MKQTNKQIRHQFQEQQTEAWAYGTNRDGNNHGLVCAVQKSSEPSKGVGRLKVVVHGNPAPHAA